MRHGGVMKRINSGLTASQWLNMWRECYYGNAGEDGIIIDIRIMRPEHERKAA